MIKINLFSGYLLLTSFSLSQTSFNASGGTVSNNSGSVSYTIGQVAYQSVSITQPETNLDMKTLPSASYFVEVHQEYKKAQTFKIIKN